MHCVALGIIYFLWLVLGVAMPNFALGQVATTSLGSPSISPSALPPASPFALPTELPAGFVQKQFLATDGTALTYYDSGKPKNASQSASIVFVPGWSMPGWIWFAQAAQFVEQFRVIVFDPRGQGLSSISQQGYDYARRSRDLAELLQDCNCSQVVLVGWSLGGLEALQFVAQYPAAVSQVLKALVLVDHSIGVGKPPTWDPSFMTRLRAEPSKAVGGFVRGMFKHLPPKSYLDALTQAALRLPNSAAVQLLSQSVPREFWRDAVVNVPVPVLYMVIPKFAEQAQIIKTLRPSVRVKVFENSGHALFVDEAELFTTTLRDFAATSTPIAPPHGTLRPAQQ
jgi:non-heme chloroperoxidase